MTDLLYEREGAYLEGEQTGLAKGLAVGRKEERREMAKGLRDDGVPLNIIAKRSGLSEEDIKAL